MKEKDLIEILIVEDNPGDIRLIGEALKENKNKVISHFVNNGKKALEYLRHEGDFKNTCLPDLILLDLNLPGLNGRQVLSEIKSDEKLMQIPVVILTSSQADDDILNSYKLQANCYLTKPPDLKSYFSLIQDTANFWLRNVKLPFRENLGI